MSINDDDIDPPLDLEETVFIDQSTESDPGSTEGDGGNPEDPGCGDIVEEDDDPVPV